MSTRESARKKHTRTLVVYRKHTHTHANGNVRYMAAHTRVGNPKINIAIRRARCFAAHPPGTLRTRSREPLIIICACAHSRRPLEQCSPGDARRCAHAFGSVSKFNDRVYVSISMCRRRSIKLYCDASQLTQLWSHAHSDASREYEQRSSATLLYRINALQLRLIG